MTGCHAGASLALVQEEGDLEDEPMELAPSRIEKALRLPLAALPFGGIVLELLDLAHEQYDSAIAQTVGEITADTGAELLIQRIRDDPEVRATVIEALSAAGRTGLEAKRRALSKLVTAAILDDARVDEAQLLILALRDLEGPSHSRPYPGRARPRRRCHELGRIAQQGTLVRGHRRRCGPRGGAYLGYRNPLADWRDHPRRHDIRNPPSQSSDRLWHRPARLRR